MDGRRSGRTLSNFGYERKILRPLPRRQNDRRIRNGRRTRKPSEFVGFRYAAAEIRTALCRCGDVFVVFDEGHLCHRRNGFRRRGDFFTRFRRTRRRRFKRFDGNHFVCCNKRIGKNAVHVFACRLYFVLQYDRRKTQTAIELRIEPFRYRILRRRYVFCRYQKRYGVRRVGAFGQDGRFRRRTFSRAPDECRR